MIFQRRISRAGLLLLLLCALLAVSCRKAPAAPPPPPAVSAPPPPAPAPVITLRASSTTIDRGQSVTLEWQSQNANSVQITPELGTVPASGSRQVSPASSVTYSATATGPGGSASDTARITVNVPAPPPAAAPPPSRPEPTMGELFDQNVRTIYFDYDQSEIRADQIPQLQSNVTFLRQQGNVRLTIEGHADERGSQEYNLGLGDRRANAVREYFVSQGIAANRVNVVSLGEERPTCTAQTEACWQQNRRAAFVLNQ